MPLEFADQHLTPEQEAALKPIGRRFGAMIILNTTIMLGVVVYMGLALPSHFLWAALAFCVLITANRVVMERMAIAHSRITGWPYRRRHWSWAIHFALIFLMALCWIIAAVFR